ncbi:hypothetical protein [Erythrobacter aureus]|uniref:hypothetical protein n=2 Tax=Erythrobacter TaxID=1041 RepID=UPI003A94AF2B
MKGLLIYGEPLVPRGVPSRLCGTNHGGYDAGMLDAVLSITVLAAILLIIGAFFLWRRTGNVKNALLMVLLAAVALMNVAIWTLPDAGGEAPLDRLEQGAR